MPACFGPSVFMLAFILLRGKDFSIPEPVSVIVVGLFFGLIAGLFYYQHYLKTWFWILSLVGGVSFTFIFHQIFLHAVIDDDTVSIERTVAAFAIPLALTLLLNHGLYILKLKK